MIAKQRQASGSENDQEFMPEQIPSSLDDSDLVSVQRQPYNWVPMRDQCRIYSLEYCNCLLFLLLDIILLTWRRL